jgi:predicted nucleotide-binding protein (sugar kinase/HSP70/actin superfamily)
VDAFQAHTSTSGPADGAAPFCPETEEGASLHYRRPHERPFTRAERDRVVILVNAVTRWHDPLIQAALDGLGYQVEALPVPTKADFQAGREFGNNGMCNPAYFTIGALLNHLGRLRDVEGLSVEEIAREYVFVTAGSCGPCRYGMYESEARLALANGGFEDFRVLTFQQQAGLTQSGRGGGIDYDLPFALALLNALALGDLLNELAFQMRPYEVERGRVDEALAGVVGRVAEGLRHPRKPGVLTRLCAWVLHPLAPELPASHLARLFSCIRPQAMEQLLRECAAHVRHTVEVDQTRAKPICKIVGEFFSQMTEGDGNFRMFSFLEENGAEVLPEALTTWICYLLTTADFQLREDARIRKGVRMGTWRKRARLRLARWLIEHVYERYRRALGGTAKPLPVQERLARLADPYYNRRCAGGEGYMEVGKTIECAEHAEAHMVLSLKPFGCLPSTQSDGAQAAVTGRYPDLVFLPVETSGEGDVNAHSRVLMALEDAKERSESELRRVAEATGVSLEDVRAHCRTDRQWRRPLTPVPKKQDVAGRAANFVAYVAQAIGAGK